MNREFPNPIIERCTDVTDLSRLTYSQSNRSEKTETKTQFQDNNKQHQEGHSFLIFLLILTTYNSQWTTKGKGFPN